MALFKKRVELSRFLHHAVAATFTGGFPIARVEPSNLLTTEQRVRAAEILRVQWLVAHYFALLERIEVSEMTARILRNALQVDDRVYCRKAAALVTEHSVQALSFALTEVKLVS